MTTQTLIEQFIEINPKVMMGKPVIKLVYRLQKYIRELFWLEWRNCLLHQDRKRCLSSFTEIWIN